MKNIKFDIDFIDKHFENISDKGIFLFSEKESSLRLLFLDQLIQANLQRKIPCMLISNISMLKENDVIKKSAPIYLSKESFSMLEIPLYINTFIHGSVDMNQCINDLKIYFENLNPSLVVIQHIELLFKENQQYINTTLLSQFLNFIYTLKTCIFIDASNFDDDDIQICEKFTSGIFHFITSKENRNHQIILRNFKNLKDEFSVLFSIDAGNKITPPSFRINEFTSIHECKQVVLSRELAYLEDVLSELFTSKLEFVYYDSIEDIRAIQIDYRFALFLILATSDNTNGWLILPTVRMTFPFCKVLFLGSVQTPVYQKVRARKMGADKFIIYPINVEQLKRALNEVYYFEDEENSKHLLHKILYVSDEFISADKPLMLYKQTLFRFIKDFAFITVKNGETVHFYKICTYKNTLSGIDDLIGFNNKIIFISSYFWDNKQILFLIYKNLNRSDSSIVFSRLKKFSYGSVSKSGELTNKILGKTNDDLQTLIFPLDKTNIDDVLEWIYDGL